jgi:hypothetical protein
MDVVGFDGKVHRPPPSFGKWMAYSLLIALAYWILLAVLAPSFLSDLSFPFRLSLTKFFAANLPVVLALSLAVKLRLTENDALNWFLLYVAASLVNSMASVAVLFGTGL